MEVFLDPNRGIRVDDPIELTKNNVMEAIGNSIRVTARDFSLHLSLKSFKVKYVNPITKICIIRASREDHREVWQAITLITRIKDYPVIFNLLKLTGSIEACKKAGQKCEESKFEQYKLIVGSQPSPKAVQKHQNCLEELKRLEP
ncbi:hypothetical protein CDL15_Pgr021658 [Punica granatum]|uniref:Uncharacterized protein n=2 Tax=Punica granatum TaxID=22663 RepID=A0A218WRM7_PUNGR|nr:hypothetical protein CDL15_Pgr021658 [Punica granatum]